ncbi:hypothetical protein [Salinibacillus xinjiangensis]|nr:hypothetical protein [Salinibacillus xinjiangensis]
MKRFLVTLLLAATVVISLSGYSFPEEETAAPAILFGDEDLGPRY